MEDNQIVQGTHSHIEYRTLQTQELEHPLGHQVLHNNPQRTSTEVHLHTTLLTVAEGRIFMNHKLMIHMNSNIKFNRNNLRCL